ncbi:hypothetical protein [Bradyrhizobium erythrophlei]|uniref:Uncharacterized protein n=1 Tax=Bradyrhizobium erythrophlei TaxID=1437360 RepID=A0A1M5R406_9BRAD|nr:hypothetical protein [Bradyrhizobium erythrophlei]SHH21145.1 hypothetical protein SAMN05444169_6336 [Bradyrhizobium erythrophlei]
MEFAAASAAANALRVGLNVAVQRSRPELEFYFEVHNDFGPVQHLPERQLLKGVKVSASEHRHQDIFISFFVVNIGSRRAETITLTVGDQFSRRGFLKWGEIFGHPIHQMAPGQLIYLFRLGLNDLHSDDDKLKDIDLTVSAAYNGPRTFWSWLPMLWPRLRKRTRYRTDFVFNAKNIATDLPPARYA